MLSFTQLPYHILGEVITCILSFILCVNILATFSPYEIRHRVFLYAGISTFLAALFNIFSVICIANYKVLSLNFCTTVSTLYFVLLMTAPCFLSSYGLHLALSYRKHQRIGFLLTGCIYLVYFVIIMINLKTGWVFHYDSELGYVRGALKSVTFITTGIYGLLTIFITALNRKSMAGRIFVVFLLYPFLSTGIVFFQMFLPKVILTGTSSFAALLLAYISIQSDMLEFDTVTGLMTSHKLYKHLDLKKKSGVLYVISIDNINLVQNNMEVTDMNKMLLDIGKEFTRAFQRNSYHFATGRFAGIAPDMDSVRRAHRRIKNFILKLNNSESSHIPVPLEVYHIAVEFAKGEKMSCNVMEIVNNLLKETVLKQDHQLQICDETVLMTMERKRKIFEILKRELNLNSKQFKVCFQPIYSIKEKQFTYMEALSRLEGTELGDISPQEFVEVAESKGLIEKLGFVAFEKVCKYIADNRDVVHAVSINFSVYQMLNPNIVSNVLLTIEHFGLKPSNIIMEITESIFIDNFELVCKHMKELAAAGVKFYLDDFGTGYSNLSNVIGLPFSTIKIDRSLVLMMEEDENKERFFCNLLATLKNSGVKILVEGVETQRQNEIVEKAGADYIQGFLYSRPLSAEKCVELLKKQIK